MSARTVALTTLGCKVNQYESAAMAEQFERAGYAVVAFDGAADVYVVNTCAVTAMSEKKSRQLVRRARRRNAAALVVVTGCYAQLAPADVAALDGVDLIVGTQNRQRLVALVERAMDARAPLVSVGDISAASAFEELSALASQSRTRAVLKIQEGCQNFCSYCVIPYTRGPLRSRPLASVQREASRLVAAGFVEIVLTGIHLGAYGRDLRDGTSLVDACRAVLAASDERLARLRLGSLEGNEVAPDLLALLRDDSRMARHLHLPLQAGTDAVLRLMNRPYTTEQFADLLRTVRDAVPGIAITTDVIVGFPGESDALFRESAAFVERMAFARVHVFPYSERPGTPAAAMPNAVPREERSERVRVLRATAERLSARYAASLLGSVERVLPEVEDARGVKVGHSSTYVNVYTNAAVPLGEMASLRLTRPHRDGLWGEPV